MNNLIKIFIFLVAASGLAAAVAWTLRQEDNRSDEIRPLSNNPNDAGSDQTEIGKDHSMAVEVLRQAVPELAKDYRIF